MRGKVCIVTGSNSGTGYAAAKELAQLEATVVMMCRNIEKGEKARETIIKETNNPNIDLIVVDLSDLSQVENAVKIFKSKYKRLDVLLNNAGGMVTKRNVTPQGLEISNDYDFLQTCRAVKRNRRYNKHYTSWCRTFWFCE